MKSLLAAMIVVGFWLFGIAVNFAFWGGLIYLVYRLFFKH